jgi:hypothetical protein
MSAAHTFRGEGIVVGAAPRRSGFAVHYVREKSGAMLFRSRTARVNFPCLPIFAAVRSASFESLNTVPCEPWQQCHFLPRLTAV